MDYTHNQAASRYEAHRDGEPVGEAHYTVRGGVADFDHTHVPARFEGQGVASGLVRFALDDVRAAGQWRVRASCWYVAGWLERHPDYADLLA